MGLRCVISPCPSVVAEFDAEPRNAWPAGHLAAVESAQRDGIAGIVGDAEDLGDAELLRLLLCRIEDGVRFLERQGLVGMHAGVGSPRRLRAAVAEPIGAEDLFLPR